MIKTDLAIKIPCRVGDTIYFLDDKVVKVGRKKTTVFFVNKGIVDQIILGESMIPVLNVCDEENNWTYIDSHKDIGSCAFFSKEEAEEKVKILLQKK